MTGRPPKPRPNYPLWAGLGVAAGVTVWAGWSINFTLTPLFTDLFRGQQVLAAFLSPNWEFIWRVWDQWMVTLYIAVVATVLGCGLALAMALLASKVTSPNRFVYGLTKTLLSLVRSLPDVAYGLLFVAMVGGGPLAGVLALIMFNLGIAAKLTAETIDAVDPGPLEATDAAGAGRFQRARVAVVPQILPNYVSYSLYVFELNIRASVVLGLVGVGGIGNVIRVQLGQFRYGNLAAIIVALLVVVFILDQVSRAVRRRLI